MKRTLIVILALLMGISVCISNDQPSVNSVLSASMTSDGNEAPSQFDFDRLNGKSPTELVTFLVQEAFAITESKVAKTLMCSAALMDITHADPKNAKIFNDVETWLNANDPESFDTKIINISP